MKKTAILTIAALAALTSCTKEVNSIEPQHQSGPTITINASTSDITKAAFAENMKSVVWENGDLMTVFVMKGENQFSGNTQFTKAEGKDAFTGTFATPEEGPAETGANTYYALYPYDKNITNITNDGKRNLFYKDDKVYNIYIMPGTQNGLNNMKHIHVPMIGKGVAEGLAEPEITMKHMAAIIKVSVKNATTAPINVKEVKISVDGTEKMTGSYRVNVDSDYPLLSNSSGNNYAELKVNNGSIEAGKTGDFYIMTSRVRLNADSGCTKLTIEVTTDKDFMVIEKKVDCVNAPLIFKEGEIHSTSLEYAKTGDLSIAALDIKATPVVDFTKLEGALPDYFLDKGQAIFEKGKGLSIPKLTSCMLATSVPVSALVIDQDKTSAMKIEASADNNKFDVVFDGKKPDKTETVPVTQTIEGIDGKNYKYFRITAGKASKPLYVQKMTFTPAK